jgi:Nif-specific regulatory protein
MRGVNGVDTGYFWEVPPDLRRIAANLVPRLAGQASDREVLAELLPQLAAVLACEFVAVVQGEQGRWTVIAASGTARALPAELLGDTLDAESLATRGRWSALPLHPRALQGELLLAHAAAAKPVSESLLPAAAQLVSTALQVVRERGSQERHIARLEALLQITSQWNRTQEMDRLLVDMAEAATRLLSAERASIFLWDRHTRTLVGRPALGVEEGELRIPDNAGIVGQVVHTGECRRVNERDDQSAINRQVDKRLGFRTRSLVCVPLRGRNGELFGAFELINRIGGDFTEEDTHALEELAGHAAVALENTQHYEQLAKVRNQIADEAAHGVQLIGNCPAIEALRMKINRVADTDLVVLLTGQNGTGKEVVSQSLHYGSRRRREPFVAVNCAALTETLLESELFGHEKGAFTDARETHPGKFELAAGGTLFLDEIADMSLGGQAKLLRVLEEKIVVRVGGSRPIHTDARVIAATNRNLAEQVHAKRFREDLYYRLNVVTLELPPLRERGEDIVLLAEHFLQQFAGKARRKVPKLSAEAKKRLLAHSWPGNVRELRNLMERLVYLSPEDKIDASELAFILAPRHEETAFFPPDSTLANATKDFQCEYIRRQIARCRGNMTDAADKLGLHRSNLYRKMRQLEMETTDEA